MQRRRQAADLLPQYLGFWGGKRAPEDASPTDTLVRELREETSLDTAGLDPELIGTFDLGPPLTARDAFKFHFYRTLISQAGFEVKEGASAEIYSRAELRARTDIMPTVKFVLDNIVGFDVIH